MDKKSATYRITWTHEKPNAFDRSRAWSKEVDEDNLKNLLLESIGHPDAVDVKVERLEDGTR